MHAMKLQGSAILLLLGLMCAASAQEAGPGRNSTPPQIQTEEKAPDQTEENSKDRVRNELRPRVRSSIAT